VSSSNSSRAVGVDDDLVVVTARYWGRWVGASIILVVLAVLLVYAAANPRFQWSVAGEYLFSAQILSGLSKTLMLTAAGMSIGVGLGMILAIMRLSPNPVLSAVSWVYSWFFRGVPLLVQLLFWFFLSALVPSIALGIPFGQVFTTISTNDIISPLTAAILGLGLNEAAYMSEIVRAGLISVNRGQTEAAQAIGMTRMQTMRRVVLPQAMRIIIPPTGNELINMLKNTTLVIVIGYAELLTSASLIYARTFETIPLLIVAAAWYLVLTAVLTIIQFYVEKHYGRGFYSANLKKQKNNKQRGLAKNGDVPLIDGPKKETVVP